MKEESPIIDYADRPTENPRRRRRRREAFRLLMMAVIVGGVDFVVVGFAVFTRIDIFGSGFLAGVLAILSGIFALASLERYLDSRRF